MVNITIPHSSQESKSQGCLCPNPKAPQGGCRLQSTDVEIQKLGMQTAVPITSPKTPWMRAEEAAEAVRLLLGTCRAGLGSVSAAQLRGESQWRIQRAPRSSPIPWASPAKQKHWQERKFPAGINHHLTKAPVLLICPGVLSTHSRDLRHEEITGNSFCCKKAKEERGRGQMLPLI